MSRYELALFSHETRENERSPYALVDLVRNNCRDTLRVHTAITPLVYYPAFESTPV